jgi:hypothetical protein
MDGGAGLEPAPAASFDAFAVEHSASVEAASFCITVPIHCITTDASAAAISMSIPSDPASAGTADRRVRLLRLLGRIAVGCLFVINPVTLPTLFADRSWLRDVIGDVSF